MLIDAGFKISFQCPAFTPMLLQLNIHPSRTEHLRSPDVIYSDPPPATRCASASACAAISRISRSRYAAA